MVHQPACDEPSLGSSTPPCWCENSCKKQQTAEWVRERVFPESVAYLFTYFGMLTFFFPENKVSVFSLPLTLRPEQWVMRLGGWRKMGKWLPGDTSISAVLCKQWQSCTKRPWRKPSTRGCLVPLPARCWHWLSSTAGAELCRWHAQGKRPFRYAHRNQEKKPFCVVAASCQCSLLRTLSIMPESKIKMFTGLSSIVTEQALKGGSGAERSFTDISDLWPIIYVTLPLGCLRDISESLGPKLTGVQILLPSLYLPSSPFLPELRLKPPSHCWLSLLANNMTWMGVSLCKSGQVLPSQGRAEHFPPWFP